jgi:hypothetical protein
MSKQPAIFVILIALVGFNACKSKEQITDLEPLKNRSAPYLVNRLEENELKFDGIGMKISTEIQGQQISENEETETSFKATIRIKHDSIIWVSISPALGVEMIRMVVTRDSVKYVSKIPNNKHYYLGDFTSIEDFLGMEVDMPMLEDLLVGNPVAFDPKDKFRSGIDGQQYVLSSKYRRKMEKVVGVDDKDLAPENDSLFIDPNDKDYLKLLKKKDEEDLMIKRYWLNGESFRLEKTLFNDLFNNRSLEIIHLDVENTGEFVYPSKTILRVEEPFRKQAIEFEITRLKSSTEQEFPFEIPSDFERKFY